MPHVMIQLVQIALSLFASIIPACGRVFKWGALCRQAKPVKQGREPLAGIRPAPVMRIKPHFIFLPSGFHWRKTRPAVSIDVPALTPIPPPNMELTRKATYRLATITPRPTIASTIAPPSRRVTYRLATLTPQQTEPVTPRIRIYTPTPAPSRSIRRPELVDITAVPAPAPTAPVIQLIPFKRP